MIVHIAGDVAGGKSSAATALARALNWRVVSVDQFRDRAARRWLAMLPDPQHAVEPCAFCDQVAAHAINELARAWFASVVHACSESGADLIAESVGALDWEKPLWASLPAERTARVWVVADLDTLLCRVARRRTGRHPLVRRLFRSQAVDVVNVYGRVRTLLQDPEPPYPCAFELRKDSTETAPEAIARTVVDGLASSRVPTGSSGTSGRAR